MLRKNCKGSITIEASYIVPLFLALFALTVTMLFYYHDKSVVAAIAQETVTVHAREQKPDKGEIENYFQKRIRGKLLLFSGVHAEITTSGERMEIVCVAKKKKIQIRVQMVASSVSPEKQIREWKLLDRTLKKLGDKE